MAKGAGGCGADATPLLLMQVVVASKFDNRLKEFGERWEVDRYLSAAGYLSANVRPFFVALPKVSKLLSPICPQPLDMFMQHLRHASLKSVD